MSDRYSTRTYDVIPFDGRLERLAELHESFKPVEIASAWFSEEDEQNIMLRHSAGKRLYVVTSQPIMPKAVTRRYYIDYAGNPGVPNIWETQLQNSRAPEIMPPIGSLAVEQQVAHDDGRLTVEEVREFTGALIDYCEGRV